MYNEIRSLKKKVLKFYKGLLKTEKNEYVINFIKASINTLNRELDNIKPASIREHEKLSSLICKLGYDNDESLIISVLLLNETVPPYYFSGSMDRTKVYRVLKELIHKNIVVKSSETPARFMILDRENPFKSVIDNKIEDAEKYIKITKAIKKLI